MRPIKKAVFPVAGLGTRFLPATKVIPKEMLPIVNKPLIQFAVEEAMAAGIEEFIFVTGRGKSAIEDHFDNSYELQSELFNRNRHLELDIIKSLIPDAGTMLYTRQQEPLGLGHAVWCARHLIGREPFAVLLVDELMFSEKSCMAEVVDLYQELGGCVLALAEVPVANTEKYGIVDPISEKDGIISIKGVVEKPVPQLAPSNLSIIGRYVLQPQIFEYLGQGKAGLGGEIQLTDSISELIKDGISCSGIRYNGSRFDCGQKLGYVKANISLALQDSEIRTEILDFMKTLSSPE